MSSDQGRIIYETKGPVTRITLSRPAAHNALPPPVMKEFQDAVRRFQADDDSYICVLAGEGPSFCAGRDLKWQATNGMPPGGYARDASIRPFGYPPQEKLMVFSGRGHLRGAGGYFMLGCDVRVGSRTLTCGLNEVSTGVLGPFFLAMAEHLPYAVAFRLAVVGEIIGAEECFRLGLLTEVVDDNRLEAATEIWIERLLALPREHAIATKRLLRAVGFQMTPALHALENATRDTLDALPITQEGAVAFAEGRPPLFASLPQQTVEVGRDGAG